jgi:hypothetical protein
MANDDLYDLRIVLRVKLKRWRIDDQSVITNREWSTEVFDRNIKDWVNITELDRPGEDSYIESIEEM